MDEKEKSEKSNSERDEKTETKEIKKQKSSSPKTPPRPVNPLGGVLFPSIPSSPPRFVSLEEIMQAAKGVSNMVLAHEIAVDKDFKIEKVEPPTNSLEKQVKDIMHQAFWDVLDSQLKEDPPEYTQALNLLAEVKENLTSLLLPQHTRLRQEIDEILDLELIKQQVENEALDFQRYAQYILSVMARLCAPVRDEKIQELTQTKEVVPLFRGIMDLMDVMKIDMANFTIQQVRPHIQQQSIQYERKQFQEFLDNQKKLSGTDGLEFTKIWLKRNFDAAEIAAAESDQVICSRILISAYLELLTWNESKQGAYPETLLLDASRFLALKAQVNKYVLIGTVVLVTFGAVSELQSLQDFKSRLAEQLLLILAEDQNEDLPKLESAAAQVIHEVKKCQEEKASSVLDANQEQSLHKQIIEIANVENRIRKIVERRILEFVESVLSSPTAAPVQIPAGISVLKKELTSLAGQFVRLVGHNRAVFGEYYTDIIKSLRAN